MGSQIMEKKRRFLWGQHAKTFAKMGITKKLNNGHRVYVRSFSSGKVKCM